MKLLAATIALSALAAAVPQSPDATYMVTGPCVDLQTTTCGAKEMAEDPIVKGNHISCRFYLGEKQDDILCQANKLQKGEEARDDVSEICDALGGCTCAWSSSERQKRIGGRIADFDCRPNSASKNTPAAREQFRKSIDRNASWTCIRAEEKDKSTCESYKLDCIQQLSKAACKDPIIPDDVEECIKKRLNQ